MRWDESWVLGSGVHEENLVCKMAMSVDVHLGTTCEPANIGL
jgi:hypothetical protein